MKLFTNPILIVLLFCFAQVNLTAQELLTESINEGSIEDQFEFVIRKSTNWNNDKGQAFEVIRRTMFQTLKEHTLDSLNAIQARLDQANNALSSQKNEINVLKKDLADVQETLNQTNAEKESMSLLGMQVSKANYGTIMWSIAAVLLAGLVFFFLRWKNSNAVTKEAKEKLAEVEHEFSKHRKLALEREQKIKRQLQDVLNQQKS